jgi:outer membrane protein OmpA-like peptidoglycan-associated protein
MQPINLTVGALTAVLALSTLGAGCATKKFVRTSIDPIDKRVGTVEKKTTDQGTQIEGVEGELSRTKERLSDTDARARAAGEQAQQANSAAQQAGTAAANAKQAADGARQFAEQGINNLQASVQQSMQANNNFKMLTTQNVLFKFGRADLTPEAKQALDEFAKSLDPFKRYALEVQGFTDRTGGNDYNVRLSQQRAETVARYLATKHNIPLRSIHMMGVGPEPATAENKTREGRMQSRRVELKLYVPEADASKSNLVSAR